MLNGIDPIIIFNFKKIPPSLESLTKIPVVASVVSAIDLPAIPIYLSEKLTGVFIDTEDKHVDITTTVEATTDGTPPTTSQRPIASTVTVTMTAIKDSLGLALFSALAELVFPKVTSKEYSVTYLHGAVTVFAGLLQSFAITQNANDERYTITMVLNKPAPEKPATTVEVPKSTGTVPLAG